MSARRRAEDRLWAAAFALGIVGGTAWLLFEIGVAPVVVVIPGAMLVALGGVTVVVLSIKEVCRDHGSIGAAAKRGVRTLWGWVVAFVP